MTLSPGSIPNDSCFFSRHLKISKWVPFAYETYTFQPGVSVLVFRLGEAVHEPFKNEVFVACSSVVSLGLFSIGFQSRVIWGLISPVQDLGAGVPDVELESLTPQGKAPPLWGPSQWCSWGVVFPGEPISLSLPRVSMLSFYLFSRGSVHSVFRSLSEGIIPFAVVGLCLWEDISSGYSCAAVLNPLACVWRDGFLSVCWLLASLSQLLIHLHPSSCCLLCL